MGPILDNLSQNKNHFKNYPFSGNILARSTYKMIQKKQEKLIEMIIDEMLLYEVIQLNEFEEN